MKIRVNIQEVDLKSILPNPWNPNKQTEFVFEKERNSIREHGFIDPILVREKGKKFEIIDGEHRFKAAELEGFKSIPVNNLGKVSDATAKQLTIIMNETRGTADNELLSKLLKDLEGEIGRDKLFESMPMDVSIIEDLLATSKVNWDEIGSSLGGNIQEGPLIPNQQVTRNPPASESNPASPAGLESRVLGEEATFEYIKIDKDISILFLAQIKRINKKLSGIGLIEKDELNSAGHSLAVQIMSQHFSELSDEKLQDIVSKK